MTPEAPEHVIFVFVDGLGLGPSQKGANPLASAYYQGFELFSAGQPWTAAARPVRDGSHIFQPIDATLGYPGLPQSGTGQATLFTGVDCVEPVGRHFGPYPHSKTKDILRQENIFRMFKGENSGNENGVAFANAYPEVFFEQNKKRRRWTVTTFCCDAAGIRLRTGVDLSEGRAISAELTRVRWNTVGLAVPTITPAEAAADLHALSQNFRLTVFEYFLTDKAGHRQDANWAESILHDLAAFVGQLHQQIDPERDLLLITSDHGNIEDLSVKTHTRNPVPLIAYGAGSNTFSDVSNISGIAPRLRAFNHTEA